MKLSLFFLFIAFIHSTEVLSNDEAGIQFPDIAKSLIKMDEADVNARSASFEENIDIEEIDIENTRKLKQIIEKIGWPTISKVGEKGAIAAQLIVLHADRDPDFQKSSLSLLSEHLDNDDIMKPMYASLYDRLNAPQLYGTHGSCVSEGNWQPRTISDAENVHARRKEMGMDWKMDDYIEHMSANCNCEYSYCDPNLEIQKPTWQ